jgi:hypothetical protein
MNCRLLALTLSVCLLLLLAACGSQTESHGGHDGAAHEEGSQSGGETGDGDGHSEHGADAANAINLQAIFSFPAGAPKAGEPVKVDIRIQDKSGEPHDAFDISHEKPMHLIIVSEHLGHFSHIHPEYEGNGNFTVDTEFPSGGKFKLFADFVPTGGAATTIGKWIDVTGDAVTQPLQPEKTLVKTVEGKEVELAIDPLKPGTDAMLTFVLRDAASKEPIHDLQPYLGAVGHVVVISADGEDYLHVHPDDEAATGPEAVFHTTFPASGVYKIWGQFQHKDQLITVPFTVQVP